MYGVRPSDYDSTDIRGKKCEGNQTKTLKMLVSYGMILTRDIFNSLFPAGPGARDQKEVTHMNKYELAVVVNAKIEDDARTAAVEKVKEYITRYGGVITDVDEWGKKRLAYEIQKMREGFYYFIHFEAESSAPAEIERHVRIMENVIRYLCVRQDA